MGFKKVERFTVGHEIIFFPPNCFFSLPFFFFSVLSHFFHFSLFLFFFFSFDDDEIPPQI